METSTSDRIPWSDMRADKRPRSPPLPWISGHPHSSSAEESTNKRLRGTDSLPAHTDGRRTGHRVENNVAQHQSRVQYGDRYNEVHHHNYLRHDPHLPRPRSLEEAENVGKAQQYIDEAMKALEVERMGIRRDMIAPALVDTCQWLFTRPEYISWQNPSHMTDHHGFMWIKSKPGAGKSTLMKFLLESTSTHKQHADLKAISFFFNAGGEMDERSLLAMYRHLLHQLLSSIPRLKRSMIDDVDKLAAQGWRLSPLKNLFRTAVLDLRSERLICFIDALDESSEDEIRDLIDFFEELGHDIVARCLSFRVCFSSRHYPYVELKACRYLNLDDQYEHQQDIALYVRRKLGQRRGTIPNEILSSVQQRARGVFLWAVLVTQMLKRDYDRGDIHKVRDRLQGIPDGLHNLFSEIIRKGTGDQENLLPILEWIAFARHPLSPEQLYFAVRSGHPGFDTSQPWNPDVISLETMELFILNCSKGLAELTTGKRPIVQFIHESVKDFLQETGIKMLTPELHGSAQGYVHDRLKRCCLRWVDEQKLDYLSTRRVRTVSTLVPFPFLSYALKHMIDHAELACANGVSQFEFVEHFPVDLWSCLTHFEHGFPMYAGKVPKPFVFRDELVYLFSNHKALLGIELQRIERLHRSSIAPQLQDGVQYRPDSAKQIQ